jgi:hypothetical protein
MRVAWLLFLSVWSAATAAQTMYKCTDAQRRITYSSESCDKLGLNDAGPVADRVTSMPFTQPPKPAARKDAPPPDQDGAKVKPLSPLIDKLLK